MRKFLNNPDDAVDEMLEGYLLVHGGSLRQLDSARVVIRREVEHDKVAVVTGGGSGHKPAFLGYVGPGMLDAVVVGDIFTSPPAGAVLEAIKAADTGRGVILLLGNYAGDLMNFEIAARAARKAGHDVLLSIATDDIGAGFHDDVSRRRGVVGEFFIWKAAGALAARGGSLEEIKRLADDVNARTRTIGVASGACTVPALGHPTFKLADGDVEMGVGHHGERGTRTEHMRPADEIVTEMVNALVDDLPYQPGDQLATMVNGLGATPLLELYVAHRQLARVLSQRGIALHRAFVGEYFTALEMAGFSITLVRLSDELKGLIDAPTVTPHFVQR